LEVTKMNPYRRNLLLGLGSVALSNIGLRRGLGQESANRPLFVATWNFGLPACKKSLEILTKTGSVLDAVEQGIQVAEADQENDSVGIGGAPNADGVVQLDACFMDGETHKAGSVAALEDYPHPISVARRVMEKTKHVMLVGSGASAFAKSQGFVKTQLLTDKQKAKWEAWNAKRPRSADGAPNHDTISLVGMDANGHLAGGCSTSGLAYKLAGRVGDSPILGSGLYVDGEIGAAGATGIGENVMRYCASFLIVELMRIGLDPEAACSAAISRIAGHEKKKASELHINFLAIDKQGRWGAAGTDAGFEIAVVTPNAASLHKPKLIQ
jgi:N4-(beta-N-acetylglucosaminyl)-L-asparaginase